MKNYPKTIGGKQIYVVTPVQIQELDLEQSKLKLEVGKWMAVNVHLPEGYTRMPNPVQFETEEECQKACDKFNAHYNFRPKQVKKIIAASTSNIQQEYESTDHLSGDTANN